MEVVAVVGRDGGDEWGLEAAWLDQGLGSAIRAGALDGEMVQMTFQVEPEEH